MENIEIVRGTTNTFRISITDKAGKPYIPLSGDRLVFGVKKNRADTTLLIVKSAPVDQEGRAQGSVIASDISFAHSRDLTNESVQSITDHLDNRAGKTPLTITFHPSVVLRHHDNQKQAIEQKNWKIKQA